jgi:hypothetical protein
MEADKQGEFINKYYGGNAYDEGILRYAKDRTEQMSKIATIIKASAAPTNNPT